MPTRFIKARPGQCRFIAGEPSANALICGEPVKLGSSYCSACHARLYRPTSLRGLMAVDYSVRRAPARDEEPVELTEVFAA